MKGVAARGIENWQAVSGKKRIDLATDPPPDIAIEVDITNFTQVSDYAPFKVPEVWLIRASELAVFALSSAGYVKQSHSQFFPNIDLRKAYRNVLGAIANGASPPRAIRQVLQTLL